MTDKINTTPEAVEQAMGELTDLTRCRCHEGFTSRNLRDPDCNCDSADAVKTVSTRIEELEAQLNRAAAVLRISLKYNTAMHGGAAAHNQRLRDTLAEIENAVQAGARIAEIKGETP